MNLSRLKNPFPPESISWRVGTVTKDKSKGMALAYLDARDVMERLDEVCGGLWQCRYPFPGCCEIGIKIESDWVWRGNGVGETVIRDEAKPEERVMKEKGNYSDAFKRAAVLWGIGRYLYDLPSPWVEIDQYRKIKDAEIQNLTQRLAVWQAKKFKEAA